MTDQLDAILQLTGDNIVCFAKDWSEDPTSNHHVMAELAKHNRVLWLNSISTRSPNLASGKDLRKILRKLGCFLRGPEQITENLFVYTPLVLPFPHSTLARTINRWILRFNVRRLRRKLGMREFQLWSFIPTAADYVGTMGESLSVYYCTDEWSKFTYVDGPRMAEADRLICQRSDIIFATARSLVDARLPLNPETHLARHGVKHTSFAAALDDSTALPTDLAVLPKPILGFYGLIQDWVDLDLIAFLAQRHPEWSIVLIGKVCVDVSKLLDLPNVHLLGRKPHDQLPAYCKGFSVGIVPYILNERILHGNPIKLREYLSAGLPVVSTPLPEAGLYAPHCAVASTHAEFERAVQVALCSDTPELRRRRSESMRSETWERKVADMVAHILRVKRGKTESPRPVAISA